MGLYHENHNLETVLLRVQDDIHCALDTGDDAIIILLDLTSFDMVDPCVLLYRFETDLTSLELLPSGLNLMDDINK